MTQKQSTGKITTRDRIIILLSIIGLMVCFAVLLPQTRQMIMNWIVYIFQKEAFQTWIKTLPSYAMGGICFILFFDYCTLTDSGRVLVQKVRQEIEDCLSEIDYRSFIKPFLLMSGVYLLGILTIIRADFSYLDDVGWAIFGHREWYNWSRYLVVLLSYIVQPEIRMTDISPLPQLLAVPVLACSSVLLAYITGNKKITGVRLLASIPLGLSPFFLECLAFKFMAPYMALSILASIVPFLFIDRKKAFLFCSVACLWVMCMTYQAASGIYPMIAVILCFRAWNNERKPDKEILSFLGRVAFAFCFALLFFRFFLMRPPVETYTSTEMYPVAHIISGTLSNIKEYVLIINRDLGMIWKIGIALILFFFIAKSMYQSSRKKLFSFFVSILFIGISFVLSFGVYSLLAKPLYEPRALLGFGVFLAIVCIYVVSDYKKSAIVAVLALNWCFLIFAFSYGNALADQARYANFRTGILLHDLNTLFPNRKREDMTIQFKNSIDYAPSVKNIAKHYPVIERLVPKRLGESWWDICYFLEYFNYSQFENADISVITTSENGNDSNTLNLPVMLDSYYHTIQSDGDHILVTLKH